MSEIVMTGERFIPESKDDELELEHMERYYTACRFVEGKVVLDAACGEGYGSYLLARTAKKVIGVDIDSMTILNAKEKYSNADNIQYIQGNIQKLDFMDSHTVDVVISFETIEHVSETIQKDFMSEIKRILKQDGLLIMSSPNKKEYTDRYHFHNRFHVHELYVDEFVNLLKTQFQNVQLYRQYLEVVSIIDGERDEENILYRKNKERYNPEGKYVIAIASNADLPKKSLSMINLHLREEYLPTLDELNYCRGEVIKCRSMVKQLESQAEHLMDETDVQKNQLKLSNEELERRGKELEHRMDVINKICAKEADRENELKLAKEELDRRAAELEHRMDVINHLNERIHVLENDVKLKDEELDRRAAELEHRMDVINELRQQNHSLNRENYGESNEESEDI